MVDAPRAIREYLLGQEELTNLVEQRIYAEVNSPPAGYTPAGTGPAICFKTRGGGQDYEGCVVLPSVQFKCYGETEEAAQEVARTLYDALNDRASYAIKWAMLEQVATTLREMDTGWIFSLSFFSVFVTNG